MCGCVCVCAIVSFVLWNCFNFCQMINKLMLTFFIRLLSTSSLLLLLLFLSLLFNRKRDGCRLQFFFLLPCGFPPKRFNFIHGSSLVFLFNYNGR